MDLQVEILQYLEQLRSEPLTLILTTITMMAESLFLIAVVAIIYWCLDKQKGKRLGWFILSSGLVNNVVKNIIQMPRPFEVGAVKPLRVQTATGTSFPSGHTQAATSFWFGSMLLLKNKAVIILGSILIGLTALSRLYLGVHWPMDTIGAVLFGVTSVLVADRLINESCEFKEVHLIGASLLVVVVLLTSHDKDLCKITAALWGLVVGGYIEQKYINFNPKQVKKVQIKKVIIGMLGVVGIYLGLKAILPSIVVCDMLRYALVLLWVACGAPYCFKQFKMNSSL